MYLQVNKAYSGIDVTRASIDVDYVAIRRLFVSDYLDLDHQQNNRLSKTTSL